MIGPVSGTGRAMMASLQQAIQKGMPPDQAVQYVKSMAVQGVAPLADLYAMMNQFQRLKQQQAKPPQNPPTIKDQLDVLGQQQRLQSEMQARQDQNMQRGLGGIDAGSMENPRFAGGGVVALAEGGDFDVEQVYSRGKPRGASQFDLSALYRFGEEASPEELARMYAKALSLNDFDTATRLEPAMIKKGLSQDYINYVRKNTAIGVNEIRKAKAQEPVENILYGNRPAATPAPTETAVPPAAPPAAETPPARRITKPASVAAAPAAAPQPTLDESIAEIRKPLIERGLLTAEGKSVAGEKFRDYLTSEEARMEKEFGKDKSLALAEAGFRMAGAASRPGATFLGALSEGGVSYSQAIRGMNKELQANRRQMMQARHTLDKADELEARGEVDRALELRQKAQTRADDLQKHRDNLMVDYARIEATREGTAAQVAATRESARSRVALAGVAQRTEENQMVSEYLQTDPIYKPLVTALGNARKEGKTEEAADIRQQMKQRINEVREELGLSAADVTAATRGMEAAGGGRGVTFLGYE